MVFSGVVVQDGWSNDLGTWGGRNKSGTQSRSMRDLRVVAELELIPIWFINGRLREARLPNSIVPIEIRIRNQECFIERAKTQQLPDTTSLLLKDQFIVWPSALALTLLRGSRVFPVICSEWLFVGKIESTATSRKGSTFFSASMPNPWTSFDAAWLVATRS
ncbi:hypothetical protein BDZ45DRAFT_748033 [Acephala macrosclerotiorum]|nr:hypothetical protein BDZ45DRAFT_748033 [Acephala macrosclerotiorum]